ncbi:MAG: hypothetical protein CVT60_05685, partial [Actinobacteria bacterium HGW-Actinobacteria-10]
MMPFPTLSRISARARSMMIARTACVVILVAMLLTVFGCSADSSQSSTDPDSTGSSAETSRQAEVLTAQLAATGYHVPAMIPVPGEEPYDANGIRRWDYGKELGLQYLPLEICNDAIQFHKAYHQVPEGKRRFDGYEDEFLRACGWLLENAEVWEAGGLLLLNRHDLTRLGNTTPGPWPSALTQGRTAKVMALAYEWTKDERYAEAARKFLRPVMADMRQGGLTYTEGSYSWFEEYPVPEPDHVLNGHQSVILDMMFVAEAIDDAEIESWARKGSESLVRALPDFELAERMAWALSYEVGSTFASPQPVVNPALNYDRIHILYLKQL